MPLLMGIGPGLKYRHDLSGRGKAVRGWKGLALVVNDGLENGSCKSDLALSLGSGVEAEI